jgi:hypothetical protein
VAQEGDRTGGLRHQGSSWSLSCATAQSRWRGFCRPLTPQLSTVKEGVEHLDERSLLSLREAVDISQPSEEWSLDRGVAVSESAQPKQLVRRDLEDTSQLNDEFPVKASDTPLVVRDRGLVETNLLAELALGEAAAPAQAREAVSDGFFRRGGSFGLGGSGHGASRQHP